MCVLHSAVWLLLCVMSFITTVRLRGYIQSYATFHTAIMTCYRRPSNSLLVRWAHITNYGTFRKVLTRQATMPLIVPVLFVFVRLLTTALSFLVGPTLESLVI